jgi:hypothetical protein
MKKKILAVSLTLLLALIVSTMIFAPLVARKYINKHGKELVGRTVSLKKIHVNYFTFTFRFIGFKLFEKNDTSVFIRFDTLLVDLQPLRLIHSELALKRLWLINPVSNIIKRDTLFNFSDIIDFFSSPDTTAGKDTSSTSANYKFALADIRFINGRISYVDENVNDTTYMNNLSFSIPYISWNQKESSKAGLKFNFRNGGYFLANGNFDPASGDFNTKITVNNLDLRDFSAYVKPYLLLNSMEGLAGCNINVRGNSNFPDSLSVDGGFSVTSFTAIDNKNRKVLGAEKAFAFLKKSLPMSDHYVFDSISLIKPYLLFEMHDSTNNFIELLPPEQHDTLAKAKSDTESEPYTYAVNKFIIRDGIVDYLDNTLKEPFTYHLSRIKLNIDSVSSRSTWLTAYSSMKLNEQGDLKAELGINPADPYELKVDYVITNFQLTDLSPYSKLYVGSAIVYGNMHYAGKTSITARQITSENKLIIRNAELGKKSGGIYNIPLRLALYLIKDKNGDITIDLPISGDLNDPKIKIWPLVWATFKNFIVKVASAPFVALSNLFGMDQKDLQQLDFNYADTLLSDNNKRKLDQLLLIRQKKPELTIELAYFNDREKEKDQVGIEEAGRIFKEKTGNDYLKESDQFKSFLKTTLGKDSIDLYVDCIKVAGIEKVNAISLNRDNLRVKLIENYINSKDTASHIRIFVPNAEVIKNAGSLPVFEIKFSMEE